MAAVAAVVVVRGAGVLKEGALCVSALTSPRRLQRSTLLLLWLTARSLGVSVRLVSAAAPTFFFFRRRRQFCERSSRAQVSFSAFKLHIQPDGIITLLNFISFILTFALVVVVIVVFLPVTPISSHVSIKIYVLLLQLY